jgi:myosin heavy chain 6/7
MEINKKREAELFKLKQELDDATLQHETNLANLRQKHNSLIADLGDQIDQLNKGKAKLEQAKNVLMMELNQSRHSLEELNLEKATIDKNNKMMQNDISNSANRLDDLYQALNDGDIQKKKLASEKSDLEKQIQDGENEMRNLAKLKTSLTTQLDDMKRLAEAESHDKACLVGKFRALESDLENLRERIEEENAHKAEYQRQLSKAVADAQIWKSKFTTEAMARIEDLENAKAKILARIAEAEDCIEGLSSKVVSTEKIRNRYQIDLEDLQLELERINSSVSVAEKKLRNFDAVVGEWKLKCDDIGGELEASQRECRNVNSELFRLKVCYKLYTCLTTSIHFLITV